MNPPPEFVESELVSVKGRREGEDNGIGGGSVMIFPSEEGYLLAPTR
jgi:hypothetical protein